LIIIAGSYGFMMYQMQGTKRHVITSGNLYLELEERDGITLSNAYPVADEVGMIYNGYDFKLTNKSDVRLKYAIKLVDVTKQTEVLALEDLRYGLVKNGTTTFGYICDLTDNILDTGAIGNGEVIHYSFHMWIRESLEDETRISGKTRSYKVTIEAVESDEDIILAATLDGETLTEFPTAKDNYGVESIDCTDNLDASFDPTTWSVTVDGIQKSATTCIVNFSSKITLAETDEAIKMKKSDLYAFYKGSFSSTARSSEILAGKTAYINGVETKGTMPNHGSLNWSPATSTSYTIPAGYYTGGTLSTANAYNAGKLASYVSPAALTMAASANDGGSQSSTTTLGSISGTKIIVFSAMNTGRKLNEKGNDTFNVTTTNGTLKHIKTIQADSIGGQRASATTVLYSITNASNATLTATAKCGYNTSWRISLAAISY